jgi:hypothetical protein
MLMLVRGMGAFGPTEVAIGRVARLAGAILMLPLLVGVTAALVENRSWGLTGPEAELGTPGTVIEMFSILLCGAVGILLVVNSRPAKSRGG